MKRQLHQRLSEALASSTKTCLKDCSLSRVVMEVQRVGSGTMLNQISSLVERAQSNRAPVQTVADNIAAWFIPCVLALSAATAFVWYLLIFVFQVQTIEQIAPGATWPIL